MAGTSNSGGRNARSAKAHVLAGTFRKDRHAQHQTPDPPSGTPAPPKALTADERGEWDRMVGRMERTGALSTVDDAALYQYVQLFAETESIKTDHARLRKLSAELKGAVRGLEGVDLVAAVGEIVKLQQVLAKQTAQLRQGHMALRQYLVEFGMTPSARSRVKLPGGKPAVDTKRERFFGRGSA